MSKFSTDGFGYLQVRTAAAEDARPVSGVLVKVYESGGRTPIFEGTTDENGLFENMTLPCPPKAYSLTPDNTEMPYGIYDLSMELDGWEPLRVNDFQVFDQETTLANMQLQPLDTDVTRAAIAPIPDSVTVPAHSLYAGGGGSGEPPMVTCNSSTFVLTGVVIPEKVTVHLGKPSASAQNVTVTFRDYIKNVASSEVYPTWVGSTKPTHF